MEEWKKYRLSELSDLIAGFAFKSTDFGNVGSPVIKIKDIQPPFVTLDATDKVDISKYNVHKLEKYLISQGDFLMAMTGATIGKVGRYVETTHSYLNQRVLKFVPKQIANKSFIYYVLLTHDFQSYVINHIDSESAQPNISANTIGKYELRAPSLKSQIAISNILNSLDDKIELNNRINHNLEQQAQALFKSWFIDYEPFRDGEFVDSELGRIPKGWQICFLGDIMTESREKVGNRKDIKVLSPIANGNLILSEEYFTKRVYSESLKDYLIVRPYCFAYNPARINIGSIGMNENDFDGCVSPVYVVIYSQLHYEYFFDLFRRTDKFKEEVIARSIGGVRQTLGFKDFSLIKIVYPPLNVIINFNEIYRNILDSTQQNILEIDKLSTIRDSLLPKLMSGEITIKD